MRFSLPGSDSTPDARHGRRRFVFGLNFSRKIGRQAALFSAFGGLLPFLIPRARAANLEPTMKSVVETLIPADAISPSASELGVHRNLLEKSRTDKATVTLFEDGFRWLDNRAGGSFDSLAPQERVAVLSAAENSKDQRIKRFFLIIRQQTMEEYYALPEAAKGFSGFSGPPQPDGYPDHAFAPITIKTKNRR